MNTENQMVDWPAKFSTAWSQSNLSISISSESRGASLTPHPLNPLINFTPPSEAPPVRSWYRFEVNIAHRSFDKSHAVEEFVYTTNFPMYPAPERGHTLLDAHSISAALCHSNGLTFTYPSSSLAANSSSHGFMVDSSWINQPARRTYRLSDGSQIEYHTS